MHYTVNYKVIETEYVVSILLYWAVGAPQRISGGIRFLIVSESCELSPKSTMH